MIWLLGRLPLSGRILLRWLAPRPGTRHVHLTKQIMLPSLPHKRGMHILFHLGYGSLIYCRRLESDRQKCGGMLVDPSGQSLKIGVRQTSHKYHIFNLKIQILILFCSSIEKQGKVKTELGHVIYSVFMTICFISLLNVCLNVS